MTDYEIESTMDGEEEILKALQISSVTSCMKNKSLGIGLHRNANE
jgi:hypothetical protein